jgi:hypothetical protein
MDESEGECWLLKADVSSIIGRILGKIKDRPRRKYSKNNHTRKEITEVFDLKSGAMKLNQRRNYGSI